MEAGLGPIQLKGGLIPQPCLKAPRETQQPPVGRATDMEASSLWRRLHGSPGPRPGQPPPLKARATRQALGRVSPLPPPSAPSSFLQGPARAGNGAYPDPIRMLARLLPGARGGRARGGLFLGL